MANYNDNVRSFINGLSDFWLLYFKELDTLQAMYSGAEIEIGQTYLDLMGLLLNNSVKDTPLFNKEYFKLLEIRETDIKYRAGTSPASDRYIYSLPDNLVTGAHLNNKVIAVTASLDRDVDYHVNADTRAFEFLFDPLNAYLERTFGTSNGSLRVRSRYTDPTATITINFVDTGTPLVVTSSGFAITVTYDGPAHTSTTKVSDIVAALNLDPNISQLVLADIAGLGTGNATIVGSGGAQPLLPVAVNAVDNFATKNIDLIFGGEFTVSTVADWVAAGVKKGDILRLISGPTIGVAKEYSIDLVRSDALYVEAEAATLNITAGNDVDFVVLRETDSNVSTNELLPHAGTIVQSGIDGAVVAATQSFSSATANFSFFNNDDIIEILGALNRGYYRIISVTDAHTVVLGGTTLVDEPVLNWNFISVIDPSGLHTDGVFTNHEDGTATFSAASAAFTVNDTGNVVDLLRSLTVFKYSILQYVSPTTVTLSAPAADVDGAAFKWVLAKFKMAPATLVFSPPTAWLEDGTIVVAARRYLDGQAVVPGVDYTVIIDSGAIIAKTVWRTSVDNTVTYNYRYSVVNNMTSLLSGADGTITPGTPNQFSSGTASFTQAHVGDAIVVGNSGFLTGANNNGTFVIATVVSSTVVTLTNSRVVPVTPDANNGALTWQLFARGEVAIGQIATITEIGAWAPDVLVDRFQLYNTYGYLINRLERSSEAYRALIRGLFQLFMLGPTLERFESAINVVAGLPVIRDDGEILLKYDSGAEATGTDGFFDFTSVTFSAASASFGPGDDAKYIFVTSGANTGKLFKILSVLDSTHVTITPAPTTDGPINWELSTSATQTVLTSGALYSFDRATPLRTRVTDPTNVGVVIFKAFEVFTDAFRVTDYVETPNWWENVEIPSELMPGQSSARRQSSVQLFENVIAPSDGGMLGDPGFYIGADDDGDVPPSTLVRFGGADGTMTGDLHFPLSNNVFFSTPTGAFTSFDLGNLVVNLLGSFRIIAIISPTVVQVEAFENVVTTAGLFWDIRTSPLAKRHKMAFVVLNKILKNHLFLVDFNIYLLNAVRGDLLANLQELVFVAKPSYTYIVLSPTAVFDEIIRITETFEVDATLELGGSAGEIISATATPLTISGSSWRIGDFFRYKSKVDTFAAPASHVTIFSPAMGYVVYTTKFFPNPLTFTDGGLPKQAGGLSTGASTINGVGLSVAVSGGVVTVDFGSAVLTGSMIMSSVTISGSGAANNGTFVMGAIVDSSHAIINNSLASNEAGLVWQLTNTGSSVGQLAVTADGEVTFQDLTGIHTFDSTHIGNFIRWPFPIDPNDPAMRINEIVSSSVVKLANANRVSPVEEDPDVAVGLDATTNVVTAAFGDLIFSRDMCLYDRQILLPGQALKNQYFVNFTSGVNMGVTARILHYVAPNKVIVQGTFTTDAAVTCNVTATKAPTVIPTVSTWEHVVEQFVYGKNNVVFIGPSDVAANITYTAYGVQEPIDPTLSVIDITAGDTLYTIGMSDPRVRFGRTRTARDTDFIESPIQITVT